MKIEFGQCNFQINKLTGSMLSTTLLFVLEYGFRKNPEGYFKFIEPCSHKLYKAGYSLIEELGCGRHTFVRAFKRIGAKYNSRTDFEKATDKFQGKLYASYYDRNTNLTIFIRNHELVEKTLKNISKVKNKAIKNHNYQRRGIQQSSLPFDISIYSQEKRI